MDAEGIQTITEAFHAIDLDGSGTLSRGEIIRGCREQEKVRKLLGLPRNLRVDDGSKSAFEEVFARLDPDESHDITLEEFVAALSTPESRAAVAAAAAPPSWVQVATEAPLEVDGDVPTRTRHGFAHFASEARFEHAYTEWEEEREESLRSYGTEMEQWSIAERQTITEAEKEHLVVRHRAHIKENSAFPDNERAEQRAKVEKNLNVRVAAVYKPPSAAWLSSYVVPEPDPPLELAAQPLGPHGAAAEQGTLPSAPPAPPSPPELAASPETALQLPSVAEDAAVTDFESPILL